MITKSVSETCTSEHTADTLHAMWTYLGINVQWGHIHHHPYALLDPGGRASALGVVRMTAVRSEQPLAGAATACAADTAAASAAQRKCDGQTTLLRPKLTPNISDASEMLAVSIVWASAMHHTGQMLGVSIVWASEMLGVSIVWASEMLGAQTAIHILR